MVESASKLVLDTHIWIWLLEGQSDLKPTLQERIERCAREGMLLVSAISVWEVGMLEAKGRIRFGQECSDWVRDALAAPGICLAPLEPDIAIASSRLPGDFHGDPADRIIVATSRYYRCPLVTVDREITKYAESGFVSVVDGSEAL